MHLTVTAPHELSWVEDKPGQPGPGEVTVTTRLSAVSVSSELSVVAGNIPGWVYPCKLGYQTLGHVSAAGEGVSLRPGQRVVTMLGHGSHGIHRAERVIPVPDGISDWVALCCILGEETHKGIRKVAPEPQGRVLVAGAGLLGLLTVFNLTRRGVQKITVLEPDAGRQQLALTMGAAEIFAPGEIPHDGFDVGFECSASPTGFTELLEHLRPGARCGVLSDGNWGALSLPPAFHQRELWVVASSDGQDYHAYARWLWANADPVLEQLFQAVITPPELLDAYVRLREFPRPASLLVDWTPVF